MGARARWPERAETPNSLSPISPQPHGYFNRLLGLVESDRPPCVQPFHVHPHAPAPLDLRSKPSHQKRLPRKETNFPLRFSASGRFITAHASLRPPRFRSPSP